PACSLSVSRTQIAGPVLTIPPPAQKVAEWKSLMPQPVSEHSANLSIRHHIRAPPPSPPPILRLAPHASLPTFPCGAPGCQVVLSGCLPRTHGSLTPSALLSASQCQPLRPASRAKDPRPPRRSLGCPDSPASRGTSPSPLCIVA